MEIKTIILFAVLPSLSIIFLTWLIRFPKPWVFKAVLIFEIILTVCTLVIELDTRKIPKKPVRSSFLQASFSCVFCYFYSLPAFKSG